MYFEDEESIRKHPQAIFILEPHDVMPVSIFAYSDFLGYFPGKRMIGCVTGTCYSVPFMRQIYTWANGSSVEKKNLQKLLKNGKDYVNY